MLEVSVVGPDGGELIDLGPAKIRILEDGGTTGHRLGVAEITLAPRSPGPPQHRHARHDEGFYVVRGTALFTVGATRYPAPAGTMVTVPPGAAHTFANPGEEPLVMLNTFTPDLYVHYFGDVRDAMAGTGVLTVEAAAEVMARYATEPATDYAAAATEATADPTADPSADPAAGADTGPDTDSDSDSATAADEG